jgi:hypothetical protein
MPGTTSVTSVSAGVAGAASTGPGLAGLKIDTSDFQNEGIGSLRLWRRNDRRLQFRRVPIDGLDQRFRGDLGRIIADVEQVPVQVLLVLLR